MAQRNKARRIKSNRRQLLSELHKPLEWRRKLLETTPSVLEVEVNGSARKFNQLKGPGNTSIYFVDELKEFFLKMPAVPRVYDILPREVEALRMLQDHPEHFPQLVEHTPDYIIMRYIQGQPWSKETAPPDARAQLENILAILESKKLNHNDINHNQLMVRDSKIVLVDFGSSTLEGSLSFGGKFCSRSHLPRFFLAHKNKDRDAAEKILAELTQFQSQPEPLEPHFKPQDLQMFHKYLSRVNGYFEYGSGGSTCQAATQETISKIYTVESDVAWTTKLKKVIQSAKVNYLLVDLNCEKTRWGNPGPRCTDAQKISYSNQFLTLSAAERQSVDLVLVDGRFRVACCLKLYEAISPNCLVAFGDFLGREWYHVVLEYFAIVEKTDDNSMVILKKRAVSRTLRARLTRLIKQYNLDAR